ncbi:MAG: SDR family NAD(P)-dependent oxidoreductase [Fibrobacteria bacterium]|nr:SDR family NAD(P)-dependent oxidoreductase [Fibrobacteria bacterium]
MNDSTKVALVTGANRGLGLEIARQLARSGFRVLLGARREEDARRAALDFGEGGLVPLALDVTAPPSDLAARIRAEQGRLDVLVNNAGVYQAGGAPDGQGAGSVLEVDPEAVRATLEVNALGPLALAQKLAPLLRASDDGRIVNVSSGMAQLAHLGSDSTAYRISKVALNALTLQLHAALSPRVKVFAACPGWVRTDMGGPAAPKSVAEGADTPVWLATSPEPRSGGFYQERRLLSW